MKKISFASDNYAGIHPDILQAIIHANQGHAPAYGGDDYTANAIEKFRDHFDQDIEVFFVFNGTGANVTSLAAMNHSYQAIICAEKAHIQVDECGAPEKFLGSKLLLVPTNDGKLSSEQIKHHLNRVGDQHHVQPHAISISQSTEYGTVYTPAEIKSLADFAHDHNMLLHMDGARISNAVASLKLELKDVSKAVGVDILSFGGTKNGMMLGEAVVFFNRQLVTNFLFIRKQSMQLASKMRFISAQFQALLSHDLWRRNANHANQMAALFAEKLSQLPDITLTQKVQANAIFAKMPKQVILKLQEEFHFYTWNETTSEVRLMTSFDTTEVEINKFIDAAKMLMQ